MRRFKLSPSITTFAAIAILIAIHQTAGDAHADDCYSSAPSTFTVTLPKVTNPPDPYGWNLPAVWGPINNQVGPSDSITVPNGRPIYALIVSGYGNNEYLDQLMVYRFARHLMDQGAYVHWAWWNNLLAPYMERPLHHNQSHPGNPASLLNFVHPVSAQNKAVPGENYQFLSDAKLFLQAIRANNPEAVIILVGHSMGGRSVVDLAKETNVLIDLLAPIDPVANRTYPWAGLPEQDEPHYNWTRYRATRAEVNYYSMRCPDPDWPNLCTQANCVAFGSPKKSYEAAGEGSIGVPCSGKVFVHAPQMTFGSNIINLHHRWQHEAKFPYDFATAELFNPNYPFPPGGTENQVAVATKSSGADPGGWPGASAGSECCPTGDGVAWPNDGHGEIIGGRGPVPPAPRALGFRVRTSPECDGGNPCNWGIEWPARTKSAGSYGNGNAAFRVQLLKDLENQQWNPQNPGSDSWVHRPYNSGLCLVSAGLVAKFESMNKPPSAVAGGDQVIECDGCSSANVTLDGSASFDPNGLAMTYTWTGPFGTANGPVVNVTLPLGVHCVRLEVRDSVGHIARDFITVTIYDPPIVQFTRTAGLWTKYAGTFDARAFDEFFPGVSVGGGCLLDPPLEPATISIQGGSITVAAHENGVPYCAISDSGSGAAHSDVRLNNNASVVTFDFDPPITAFYTYYGSLAIGHTATMALYSAEDGSHVASLTTPPSTDNILSAGQGFTSTVPIERIEFSATEPAGVLIGAFAGLLPGEPSLGTVNIPGYPGPNGSTVQLDFGVTFVDTCPADLTGSGSVNVSDLLALLAAWGPCAGCAADLNGDGQVNVSDLLALLAAWGPCS
jgi:hypothetical protein